LELSVLNVIFALIPAEAMQIWKNINEFIPKKSHLNVVCVLNVSLKVQI